MDEDNFDIYGDLEHFDIGEKLKEVNVSASARFYWSEHCIELLNISLNYMTLFRQNWLTT